MNSKVWWARWALVAQLGGTTPAATMAGHWVSTWWAHRDSIATFALINTVVTAGSEMVTRGLTAPLARHPERERFLVNARDGSSRFHRQSLINICMTFFASLLGGPVYFFASLSGRFLFFVGFGVFNSLLSQTFCGWLLSGTASLSVTRFTFDLFYNGTVKFGLFEWGRERVVNLRAVRSIWRVGGIRVGQDFVTTLFKVLVLSLLALPH